MEKMNYELEVENLNAYALTNEEMMVIKGGDSGDPIFKPYPPTVQI